VIRGFVGDVRSRITYELRADRGRTLGGLTDEASDRNEWITNIEDLVSDVQTDGRDPREQSWSSCGHSVSARTGMKSVLVDELF
jgi:hypothetical protein